jgi:two-component system, OmpR family, response regulator
MHPGVKILIVDDEPDICYFLSINLTKRGFITSSSNSIMEAEQELQRQEPEIMLLDNHLPDGMGIDFLNKVSVQYPAMKVVMITAHDSPQDRSKAYSNGSSFFLSKPFTIAAINQVVDLVLSSSRNWIE